MERHAKTSTGLIEGSLYEHTNASIVSDSIGKCLSKDAGYMNLHRESMYSYLGLCVVEGHNWNAGIVL